MPYILAGPVHDANVWRALVLSAGGSSYLRGAVFRHLPEELVSVGKVSGDPPFHCSHTGGAITIAAKLGVPGLLPLERSERASRGDDTTAKIWDLMTGRRLLTLRGHSFALTDVAFSPDGTQLATSSLDGTVRVYVLPIDELMAIARSRLTRGWTKAECERYLPGGCCPREA